MINALHLLWIIPTVAIVGAIGFLFVEFILAITDEDEDENGDEQF